MCAPTMPRRGSKASERRRHQAGRPAEPPHRVDADGFTSLTISGTAGRRVSHVQAGGSGSCCRSIGFSRAGERTVLAHASSGWRFKMTHPRS